MGEIAGQAVGAGQARPVQRDHHVVADGDAIDTGTGLLHHPGALVTEHGGVAGDRAATVQHRQIRAAHS